MINPFYPMGVDMAEKGAIYYDVLKPALLTKLQNKLNEVESSLTNRDDIKDDLNPTSTPKSTPEYDEKSGR
jgi:hypothetical protein